MDINIYKFTDYRQYLKDFYEAKKQENSAYSYRAFSKAAELSSENYLWQVITGRANLGSTNIRKFCKGLKLKKHESEYFENLVRFNQAKTNDEKNHYYTKLASSKRYIQVRHLEKDQFEFFSKWYYAAIHELVLLPEFLLDPEWIAGRLHPEISTREAKEAIDLLFRLGLLGRDEEGRVVQTHRYVSSGYEVASLAAANFHRQMITRAYEALEKVHHTNRDISSLTIAVSKAKLAEAKRRIHEFKRQLHEFLASGEAADAVYQLNLQLFSLSESEVPNEAS